MANFIDDTVPKGPPDLCFDSYAFIKETFSVDQFLQDHRTGGNLEIMRDDLGVYLKVLRSAMIDLINKDYADYVNLSSNLIGLDKAISSINEPLGKLKNDLSQVQENVDQAMQDLTKKLEQRKAARDKKRSLRSLSRALTSLKKLKILLSHEIVDVQGLERVVSEFSQLQFNFIRCRHLMCEQDKQAFMEMGDILTNFIDVRFLDSLKKKEAGIKDLSSCLSFYLKINKQQEVERLHKQKVVSVFMQPIVNEDMLRSLPRGLPALYEKILSFVDNDMKYLIEVTSDSSEYPGLSSYDFLLRSFWPEVEERLEINLTSIYAAGDPDVFFMRYNETLHFLKELSLRFKNNSVTEDWQSSLSFISFMDKWNLPVYFQIRFQEIVKGIEKSFLTCFELSNSNCWKLRLSEIVWYSLNRCWDETSVFLMPIAHKFWKLCLQILSRYHYWIRNNLKNRSLFSKNSEMKHSTFLVYLISDIKVFMQKLPEFKQLVVKNVQFISPKMQELLFESLTESVDSLKGELIAIESCAVSDVVSECLPTLHQVSDIPRLYRRTNKEPPSRPSPYTSALLDPLTSFSKLHKDSSPDAQRWLIAIFSDVTKQYYNSVADVLTSVQKTEESLRRLKKARDTKQNSNGTNERRPGDDDKIRLQLLLDVKCYLKGVENLGIKVSSVEKLQDLLLLVETTQKL